VAADDYDEEKRLRLLDRLDQLEDGLRFAQVDSDEVPAVWGTGDSVLWARDEPFMIYGPQGVGKTTLAHRLLLGLVGLESYVLGEPVTAEPSVLYVAADRPRQARRSWRRMIAHLGEEEREMVREMVRFWVGPLSFDIGDKPEELLNFVAPTGCTAVILDSLKDLAMDLVKDETGSRVNRAVQLLCAEGIQVLTLHHPRKAQGAEAQPQRVDEVYGSHWLTAGHGSILSIWGAPGDPIVRMRHLKQPMDEVGPFSIVLDHELGMLEVEEGVDVLSILARSGPGGLASADLAKTLFATAAPDRAAVEKARRRLEGLVDRGLAVARRPEGFRGAGTTYVASYRSPNGQGALAEDYHEK
jgi:replicative DNA helicase